MEPELHQVPITKMFDIGYKYLTYLHTYLYTQVERQWKYWVTFKKIF